MDDMGIICKNVREPWLKYIESGEKVYEGRYSRKDWSVKGGKICVGSRLLLYSCERVLLVEVLDMPLYSDFGIAWKSLGDKLIPKGLVKEMGVLCENECDAVEIYRGIFGSDSRIIEEKVVCVKLRVLKRVVMRGIGIDDVLSNDRILYNVNNLWENGVMPDDYKEKLEVCNTKNWIYLFHNRGNICEIEIGEKYVGWMKEAFKIGVLTGEFPKMYMDEMEEMCNEICIPENDGGWFVRSEGVSLKMVSMVKVLIII